MKAWKNSFLLISGIGISNLGNWIYLIAINLLVLKLTGSAAAVAGIYIIRPLAMLFTNTWAGSLIDRVNKRTLMITVDCIRGALVAVIPFISSVWIVYLLMFLINVAGAFFGPASNTYITKLVPTEKRKGFNSMFSFATSGAFLIGPSISGILIMYTSLNVSIFINAISFFLCAIATYFLPDVDETLGKRKEIIRVRTILNDWGIVINFGKTAGYFMLIYCLFQVATLLGFALDSQEATFIKQVIQLSDRDYGLLVSITGAGYLAGSMAATLLSNVFSLKMYIGMGMLLTGIGYIVFYSSENFLIGAIGFIIFGFFSSFANSGYTTFFQNNVPVDLMGRFSSTTNLLQGMVQILLTLLLGFWAELFSLQMVCLLFAAASAVTSVILLSAIYLPSKTFHYETETDTKSV